MAENRLLLQQAARARKFLPTISLAVLHAKWNETKQKLKKNSSCTAAVAFHFNLHNQREKRLFTIFVELKPNEEKTTSNRRFSAVISLCKCIAWKFGETTRIKREWKKGTRNGTWCQIKREISRLHIIAGGNACTRTCYMCVCSCLCLSLCVWVWVCVRKATKSTHVHLEGVLCN